MSQFIKIEHFVLLVLLPQQSMEQQQLKKGGVHFGPHLEGADHHGRAVRTAGT